MADMTTSRVPAAEFDEFTAQEDRRFELIDGEIIEMPVPPIIHQRILLQLVFLLDPLLPDGELFLSPLEVYLDEYNIPQPDLMWVASNSATCEVTERRLVGIPDLVIEVFAPNSIKRDMTTKLHLYERHICRDYWMIDPKYQLIEVWKRGANGFERQGVYGAGDTFESSSLGKTVDASVIFA